MSNSPFNPEMLLLLEKESDKYPAIVSFLTASGHTSGSLLTTSGVDAMSHLIQSDTNAVVEGFTLLDTLNTYDLFYMTSNVPLVERMISAVIESRVLKEPRFCITIDALNAFTSTNSDEMHAMLHANRLFMAIVILAVIRQIFYK